MIRGRGAYSSGECAGSESFLNSRESWEFAHFYPTEFLSPKIDFIDRPCHDCGSKEEEEKVPEKEPSLFALGFLLALWIERGRDGFKREVRGLENAKGIHASLLSL
jgi:hypothetical protein